MQYNEIRTSASADGAAAKSSLLSNPVVLWAFCVLLAAAPVFSAYRAIDPFLGRALMATFDGVLVLIFALGLMYRFGKLEALTLGALGILIAHILVNSALPELEVTLQGIRKTMLFPIAICVASQVPAKDARKIHLSIVFVLTYVCLYALKQRIWMSDFDYQLLAEQSAGMYTNMIWGQVRAISLLSSGFHVGMAACILASYALTLPRLSQPLRIFLYVVAAAGAYASLTRTFMILLVLVSIYAFWARSLLGKGAILLVSLFGVVVLLGSGILSLDGIVDELASDQRLTNRSMSYEGFLHYMQTDFRGLLFGFGPGSAGSGLQEDFGFGVPRIEPHNIFVKYIFELGLPFGLLLIAVFAAAIYRAVRQGGEMEPLLGSIAIIVTVSGLLMTSVETWPVIIYAGIALGLARRVPELVHLRRAQSPADRLSAGAISARAG